MKYEIEGIKKEETIKGYKILNNSIIVTYLDGNLKVFPYTKENEMIIVNEMLKQAKHRESDLYSAYMDAKLKEKQGEIFIGTSMFTISEIVATYAFLEAEFGIVSRVVLSCLGTGWLFILIDTLRCQKKTSKEMDDIEKYHLYLEIKEAIEHLPESKLYELYNGIKSKVSTLNINTIDEFSLKDLEKISNNLKLINESKLEYQPENFTYEPKNFENYTEPSHEEYVGKFSKPRK